MFVLRVPMLPQEACEGRKERAEGRSGPQIGAAAGQHVQGQGLWS